MIIKLDDTYRIEIDGLKNHTLYKKSTYVNGKNIGEQYENVIGYFNSIPSAVRRYIVELTDDNDLTLTLQEYIGRYEKISKEVLERIGK